MKDQGILRCKTEHLKAFLDCLGTASCLPPFAPVYSSKCAEVRQCGVILLAAYKGAHSELPKCRQKVLLFFLERVGEGYMLVPSDTGSGPAHFHSFLTRCELGLGWKGLQQSSSSDSLAVGRAANCWIRLCVRSCCATAQL